jgi:ABC transporter transmembrane region
MKFVLLKKWKNEFFFCDLSICRFYGQRHCKSSFRFIFCGMKWDWPRWLVWLLWSYSFRSMPSSQEGRKHFRSAFQTLASIFFRHFFYKREALQISQMKQKDGRIKMMNEILNGMKILKLYAWEESFEQQVLDIREKEVRHFFLRFFFPIFSSIFFLRFFLENFNSQNFIFCFVFLQLLTLRRAAYLNSLSSFIMQLSPFIVALVTFTTFVLIDEGNILTAEKAFVSLSLFNILRRPLALLPDVITAVVQVNF